MRARAPFCKEDSDLSEDEFNLAISGLMEKGLVELTVIDGVTHYILTDMGAAIGQHMDSDPSKQN